MIKLAILGIDNSHAWQFAEALCPKEGEKLFDDVELVGVYGDYATEDGKIGMDKIKECSACERFAEDYNEFLDEVDAVMVTARHGGNHFKFVKEYIRKGIPVWVDKPFTCSPDEICEMIALAKEYNVILAGGSCLPYVADMVDFKAKLQALVEEKGEPIHGGHVSAPVNKVNPYGNFWFYTQHLVQMMTSVFGDKVKSVRAYEDNKGVAAVYYYDDFSVTAYYGGAYSITGYVGEWDVVSSTITLGDKPNVAELKAFYEVIKDGKSDLTDRDIAAPVYIIDATIKAYEEGRVVDIEIPFE